MSVQISDKKRHPIAKLQTALVAVLFLAAVIWIGSYFFFRIFDIRPSSNRPLTLAQSQIVKIRDQGDTGNRIANTIYKPMLLIDDAVSLFPLTFEEIPQYEGLGLGASAIF